MPSRWRLIERRLRKHAEEVRLPPPMPGRLPDGTAVWLHYEPLRWERHP